jgi:hypothetical protein
VFSSFVLRLIVLSLSRSAPEYVEALMDWIQALLDNEKIFPSRTDVPFPKHFESVVKQIFKKLFRVYAHIYYSHFQVLIVHFLFLSFLTCWRAENRVPGRGGASQHVLQAFLLFHHRIRFGGTKGARALEGFDRQTHKVMRVKGASKIGSLGRPEWELGTPQDQEMRKSES